MFCSQCGTKVAAPEARFCSNCGHILEPKTETAPNSELNFRSPPTQESEKPPNRRGIILLVLLFLALIGIYSALLLSAFVGKTPRGQETGWVLIWTAVFFYFLFRRFGKKGWSGTATGLALGFIVLVAANVVAKTKQNDPDYWLSHAPEYVAIQKYDPSVFARIQSELQEFSKQRGITKEIVAEKLAPILMTVGQKALAQTTDEALVEFARSRLTLLEEVAKASANDCDILFSGKADVAHFSRINAYQSEESRLAARKALIRVIEDAIGKPRQSFNDEARLSHLTAQLEIKLKASGLSLSYVFPDIFGSGKYVFYRYSHAALRYRCSTLP